MAQQLHADKMVLRIMPRLRYRAHSCGFVLVVSRGYSENIARMHAHERTGGRGCNVVPPGRYLRVATLTRVDVQEVRHADHKRQGYALNCAPIYCCSHGNIPALEYAKETLAPSNKTKNRKKNFARTPTHFVKILPT